MQEKLSDIHAAHKSLKDAVRGTKEQTTAIVDKLSNELEYAKKQISLISEIVVDGILLVGVDGKILSANKGAELIFCVPVDELVGLNVRDVLIKPFDESVGSFHIALKNKTNDDLRLDITVSHLETTSSSSYLYIIKNVTEKTNYYKKINNLTNFQMSLLNSLPIPVYWKDEKFNFVGCNKAFEQYMGIVEKDVIGKNVFEVLKNDIDHCVFLDTKDRELMDKPEGFVNILETKFKNFYDGKTKSALHYNTPLFDTDTKLFNGMIGIIIDTTDVQLFKNIYSIIFDLIPNPIAYNDSSLRFVECNKAFCDFVGLDKGDIIGKSIHDILDGIECPEVRGMFVNLVHVDEKIVKGVIDKEYHVVRETSNCVYKLTKMPMLDQDNYVIGLTTVIVDITDDVRSQKNKACKSCSLNNSMNAHVDPLFIIDESGRMVFVNSAFCELLGEQEVDVLDKNICDYIIDEDFKFSNFELRKWEGSVAIKCKSKCRIVYVKVVPVINNQKHGMFSCGVITSEI
jgi:PAS domain S-box-containing protein